MVVGCGLVVRTAVEGMVAVLIVCGTTFAGGQVMFVVYREAELAEHTESELPWAEAMAGDAATHAY